MAGNALLFTDATPEGRPITLRVEERGADLVLELAAEVAGGRITGVMPLSVANEEALMRFLFERCNARRSVPA